MRLGWGFDNDDNDNYDNDNDNHENDDDDNDDGMFAGQEDTVEGTISFQPQAHMVRGFKKYFLGLHPDNNLRNPWFTGQSITIFIFI